uniref:J domain-containing protein n=1 Tax=Meloidogyne javanica TaxID=6303 RepID=A0A915MZW5_MELJA
MHYLIHSFFLLIFLAIAETLSDHYKTLGVSQDASADEIKAAYRKLMMKYHPDKTKNDPIALKLSQEINNAKDILLDEQKRSDYDKELFAYNQWKREEGESSKSSDIYGGAICTKELEINGEYNEITISGNNIQYDSLNLGSPNNFLKARSVEIQLNGTSTNISKEYLKYNFEEENTDLLQMHIEDAYGSNRISVNGGSNIVLIFGH